MNVGLGEVLSVAAAASWGLGVALYRKLGDRMPPVALNLYKNVIVLALLIPTVLVIHGSELPHIALWGVALAAASGLLGIAVADTMYLKALNTLGAGRLGVVGNLFSPFVIVLSYFFLEERLTAIQFAGFVLVMGGVLLVHQRASNETLAPRELTIGMALGLSAVFLNAAGIVMVKPVLEEFPFFWVAAIRMLAALLPMIVLNQLVAAHRRAPPLREIPWALLIFAAFVGQYLSSLLWLAGYKYTSASVASVLNETASIFILLFAWALLGESLTRRKLMGVALTFGGVVVMLL